MSIRSMVSALGLAVLSAGCGDDNGFTPTPESVAGPYYASTFLATQNGITADVLALGGAIDINLASDGLATGHLFVPNGNGGGDDLDLDLEGTWELNKTGDRTFSQARIQLVLTKRPTA